MKRNLVSLYLFLIFVLIYSIGSFDRIPFADCVGFVLTTENDSYIKTATATSHFLYANAAIFIKKILDIDAILANRILVVGSAALVVTVIYNICLLITKINWISIVSAFIFGFSFTFWKNAEIVEVYTFTCLWVSLFFYFLLKPLFTVNKDSKDLVYCSIFLCLAIWSHIQNIFLIPSFLLVLFQFKKNKFSTFSAGFILLFCFGFMIVVNSLQGLPFNSFYTSEQGNWVSNSFKKTINDYLIDFLKALGYLIYNFNILVILGVLGIVQLYKNHRNIFLVIAPATVLNFGFATFYAVSDNYVFFLPFNILFTLGIAYGIFSFPSKNILRILSPLVLLIPFLYYSVFEIATETEKGYHFEQQKGYKGGLRYYLLPWMNDNVGILEFTIDKRKAPEAINWMTYSAEEYIKLLQSKGRSVSEIRKL